MENLAPLNIWTCSTRWHRYLASIIEKNVLKFLYVFLFYNFARNYLMWGQVIDHRSITLCVTTWMLVVEFRMSKNPFHPTLPSPIGIVRLLSYNNYSATAANGLWKFAMRLSSWPRKSMLILQNKIIKKMTLLFIFPFFLRFQIYARTAKKPLPCLWSVSPFWMVFPLVDYGLIIDFLNFCF